MTMSTHRTARELRTVGRPFARGHDPRRNTGGRPRTPEEIKEALRAKLPERIIRLEQLAESGNERIALEANRYLVDRVLGKPTERVQTEQMPVTYTAPTDEQFRELSERIVEGQLHRAGMNEDSL
jgi:hypothetical protein